MSFLSKILGGGAMDVVSGVANVVDQFVETDEEKRAFETVMARMAMEPAKAQVELNKIEAGHRTMFVAGWRPFIGWTCGIALAYNYIARDLLAWAVTASGSTMALPPALQMEHLMTILLGMLGLGGMRTVEKLANTSK